LRRSLFFVRSFRVSTAKNVLGLPLEPCSHDPLTGFYRNGCCDTGREDVGLHLVCIRATREFLAYSRSVGNDLSTPMPQYEFPGLQAGDRWCLCVERWQQAHQAGKAPKVVLASTHISTLEFVELEVLEQFADEEVE